MQWEVEFIRLWVLFQHVPHSQPKSYYVHFRWFILLIHIHGRDPRGPINSTISPQSNNILLYGPYDEPTHVPDAMMVKEDNKLSFFKTNGRRSWRPPQEIPFPFPATSRIRPTPVAQIDFNWISYDLRLIARRISLNIFAVNAFFHRWQSKNNEIGRPSPFILSDIVEPHNLHLWLYGSVVEPWLTGQWYYENKASMGQWEKCWALSVSLGVFSMVRWIRIW